MAKIDDLENRSRRLNFRIRGLPETVTDIPEAVHSLIKSLIPDVRAHKMELDRAHRAHRLHPQICLSNHHRPAHSHLFGRSLKPKRPRKAYPPDMMSNHTSVFIYLSQGLGPPGPLGNTAHLDSQVN